MKRTCEYCKKQFNGWVKLYDHKRDHPAWVKKMKRGMKRIWGVG